MLSAPSGKVTCHRSSPSRALEASKYAESQDICNWRSVSVNGARETSQLSARVQVVASKKVYDLEFRNKTREICRPLWSG